MRIWSTGFSKSTRQRYCLHSIVQGGDGLCPVLYLLLNLHRPPGTGVKDLFVLPEFRSQGFGTRPLNEIFALTVRHGYFRLKWSCLSWNRPGLDFYRHWGAQIIEEWVRLRVSCAMTAKLQQ